MLLCLYTVFRDIYTRKYMRGASLESEDEEDLRSWGFSLVARSSPTAMAPERGDDEHSALLSRATELIQTIAYPGASPHVTVEDRRSALEAFNSDGRLRQAVTRHFAQGELDREEDLVCDALASATMRLQDEDQGIAAFAASLLPLAIKEVATSVHQNTVEGKVPLHKFVIAANNVSARFNEDGYFAARLPDLAEASSFHTGKAAFQKGELAATYELQRANAGHVDPKLFTGEVVSHCLSSEVVAGALSYFVYFVRTVGSAAQLEFLALCIHLLCHGIKPLEMKVQVIASKIRRKTGALGAAAESDLRVAHRLLLPVYSYKQSARLAVSSEMYSLISAALRYLLTYEQADPLVLTMARYTALLMRERAAVDMNNVGLLFALA